MIPHLRDDFIYVPRDMADRLELLDRRSDEIWEAVYETSRKGGDYQNTGRKLGHDEASRAADDAVKEYVQCWQERVVRGF